MEVEAEYAVLGAILQNPRNIEDVGDVLLADDFSGKNNQEIYSAILDVDRAGKPIDIISVSEHLSNIGSTVTLSELGGIQQGTTGSNATYYAELIRDKAVERRLLEATTEIQEIIKASGDSKTKADKIERLIFSITSERDVTGPVLVKTLLPAVIDDIERRFESKSSMIGISTGFTDLDKMTGGFEGSDLIILAGRPSMGKTSLAMNMGEHSALGGKSVLVFSGEMSADQLLMRSQASIGRIPLRAVRSGQLTDDHWPRLTSAVQMLSGTNFYIDDSSGLSSNQIRQRARRIHRKSPIDLIIIDYLQLMSGEGENQNLRVGELTKSFKNLAKELNVPIVCLSQLNRSLEQRADKRPIMADLRDSGNIEQDADIILFVYRDEVYDEDSNEKGTAEVLIRKQRNGECGKVRLAFQGQYVRFDDYCGDPIPDAPVRKYARGEMD